MQLGKLLRLRRGSTYEHFAGQQKTAATNNRDSNKAYALHFKMRQSHSPTPRGDWEWLMTGCSQVHS